MLTTNPTKNFDKENFTKSYHIIRSSRKLTPIQKFIIEDILSYQLKDQIYFKSVNDMANDFGAPFIPVKRAIASLLKYDWFKNDKNSKLTKNGKFFNSSNRTIDVELFIEFLNKKEGLVQPLINKVKSPSIKPIKEVKLPVEQIHSTKINNQSPAIIMDNEVEEKQTNTEEMKDLKEVEENKDGSINITKDHITSNPSEIDDFLRLNGNKEIPYMKAHVDFLDGDVLIDEVVKNKYGRYIHKYSIDDRLKELAKIEKETEEIIEEPIQYAFKEPAKYGIAVNPEDYDKIF